jgi:hypothetical protein
MRALLPVALLGLLLAACNSGGPDDAPATADEAKLIAKANADVEAASAAANAK